MPLTFASFTCQGPRQSNQDRLLEPIQDSSGGSIAAIADGVGGAPGGAEAAETAIDIVRSLGSADIDLEAVFWAAAEAIRRRSEVEPELSKMATTLSVVRIKNGAVDVAHVGDARIYHLRQAGLNTLTQDQTEVAELVRKKILTPHQAVRYPRKGALTSVLSASGDFQIYTSNADLRAGDRILLVSDGVYGSVTRGAILSYSLENESPDEFANALRQATEDAGPTDNFSCLVLQVT